ncbi:MAG: NAD(P)H-hydrate epimerase [Dehalococcoidia bacterium]|nr:NAD(P)H-hydrate epimerase [Dehalococcoidia bacterium]
MLPILSAEQMALADAHTIGNEPIASIDLMERAASACVTHLLAAFPGAGWLIVCGPGNNGGDGLAIARLLSAEGRRVQVFQPNWEHLSKDCAINMQRAKEAGVSVTSDPAACERNGPIVLVDCLFGTGLNRPLDGIARGTVQWMQATRLPIVSIDMPSGLFCEDNSVNDPEAIIKAELTLTLACHKLALLLPEGMDHAGRVVRVPIGLDRTFVRGLGSPFSCTELSDLKELVLPRPRSGHKGTFGHLLLLAGSEGMAGAAVLAASAAARSGCGLVSARTPRAVLSAVQTNVPVAMVSSDPDPVCLTELPDLSRATALAIGPGIGKDKRTALLVEACIERASLPMVLDADALNLLAGQPRPAGAIPPGTVITPHPGEFDRLAGPSMSGYQRLQRAIFWAKERAARWS